MPADKSQNGCVVAPHVLVVDADGALKNSLQPLLTPDYKVWHQPSVAALFNDIRNKSISVVVVNEAAVAFDQDGFQNWLRSYPLPVAYVLAIRDPGAQAVAGRVAKGAYDCVDAGRPEQVAMAVRHGFRTALQEHQIRALAEKCAAQSAELSEEKGLKISLLYEASRITGSVFHLETLLKMIIHLITNVMKVKICSVMLLNEETDQLEIKEAIGLVPEIMQATTIKRGQGISGWVFKEGQSLLIGDIDEDGRFMGRNEERYMTKSLLSVPLKIKDKVFGVLNVNNKTDGKPFNEEDRRVLEPLAAQIAAIIENAQLIDHLTTAKTEVKKAHDQLIRSEKFAAIGKLAASLSHEINNPLTSIYGRIQQLLRSTVDPETIRLLSVVKSEVERISRILGNLLNFAKIAKTKTQLHDLNVIVDNSLNLLLPEIKKSNISLVKDFNKKLPEVLIDGDQFMQVAINVMLNAVKAMPKGGELLISTSQDEEWIRLSVKDSGCGIDKNKLESIFDPFYSNWTDGSGTGLGLSVSKGIIEGFGGDIEATSAIGRGSTFTIKLPYKS
ncbi:MAG TPA: ATP-binding protein [bacterium]|nr:ATP-binding protein [bacterium]